MNKTVEESSLKELNHFPSLMEAIMKYLDKYWEIDAKPKGYDKYLETYEEYDTEDVEYEFNGPLDVSAGWDEFPERLSKSNVAYGNLRGRTTAYELIGAVFAYGLAIGAQREKLNEDNLQVIERARNVLEHLKNDSLSIDLLRVKAEYAIDDINFKFPQLKKQK